MKPFVTSNNTFLNISTIAINDQNDNITSSNSNLSCTKNLIITSRCPDDTYNPPRLFLMIIRDSCLPRFESSLKIVRYAINK